ncbi:MAG: hypothetical protein IPI14_05550 [Polaromonas sp.]|nr:hypothetical protein [Polaromonas sp.]
MLLASKYYDCNPEGRLFLGACTTLILVRGQQNITDSLPLATLQTAANIQHWVWENAKRHAHFSNE